MLIFLKILFWGSVLGLVHSYVLYPLILKVWASGKKSNTEFFLRNDELPVVSVIMAVYNEEAVIRKKMESLFALDYPKEKLLIFVGSDCSGDQTNPMLETYQAQHSNLRFHAFTQRRGKPGVVNNLAEIAFAENPKSANHIFLMTDASVILEPDTLLQLIKHFKNQKIAIVDSNMVNVEVTSKGISKLEKQYISSEVHIKNLESKAFGKMIGPFGGCYALRSTYFFEIPDKFLVDDFYITMRAFEKGGKAINEMQAFCYETLPDDMQEEYRRKSRISAGNFQNLLTFRHLLWKGDTLSFAFFSHKVLRWLGPFFIIFAVLSSGFLALIENNHYLGLFGMLVVLLIFVPLFDLLAKALGINLLPFRAIRYFVVMNMALLEGFFKFLNGIKNNVWEPPKRT